MEDFSTAYVERAKDTDTLIKNQRRCAAQHFGGFTIECFIKSLIIEINMLDGWLCNSDGTQHGIKNPSHELIIGLQYIPELRQRIGQFPHMLSHLNLIQRPLGHFIDIRYDGVEVSQEKFEKWVEAYKALLQWLIIQSRQLKKRPKGATRKS